MQIHVNPVHDLPKAAEKFSHKFRTSYRNFQSKLFKSLKIREGGLTTDRHYYKECSRFVIKVRVDLMLSCNDFEKLFCL